VGSYYRHHGRRAGGSDAPAGRSASVGAHAAHVACHKVAPRVPWPSRCPRCQMTKPSTALKAYLDATYPTQKVWVIGDWNDDVDTSIFPGHPSPYQNFVSDSARYIVQTKALSDAGIASTVGFPNMIDHHMNTNEVAATYVASSAEVYRVDSFVPSYATTTSDHFPVLSRYTVSACGTPPSVTITSPNGGGSVLASSAPSW
jgi:hypothetical protein